MIHGEIIAAYVIVAGLIPAGNSMWLLVNFMLNPAGGGASAGVWGGNPSAVQILKIML